MGIHEYGKKYEQTKRRVQNSGITSRNKEWIFEFIEDMVLENLSKPRLMRYLETLRLLAEILGKDFDKADALDIKKVVYDS